MHSLSTNSIFGVARSRFATDIQNKFALTPRKFSNEKNLPERRQRSPIGGVGGIDLLTSDTGGSIDGLPSNIRKNVIQGYCDDGEEFYLIDGSSGEDVTILGNCVILPFSYYSWKASNVHEVVPVTASAEEGKSLLFEGLLNTIDPPIETIIFGTSANNSIDHVAFATMQRIYRRKFNVTMEQMSFPHACATFNILNGEDRRVMVALIGSK